MYENVVIFPFGVVEPHPYAAGWGSVAVPSRIRPAP